MTLHSIDRLNILENNNILELGHGSCGHLPYLLQQNSNLSYSGLETSELMHQEAQKLNQAYIEQKQASFYLYDGHEVPFPDSSFDRIFTVNTIYFWTNPVLILSELYRIVKPGGTLNITFAQKSFMEQLPFTRFGFDLYDNEKMSNLIENTSFKIAGSDSRTETVTSKTGDLATREFTTITMIK